MVDKVVDLRREQRRRDKERRGPLVESVTSIAKEDADKVNEDDSNQEGHREKEKKEQEREGLFWKALEYEYREKQQATWIRNTLIIATPLAVIFLLIMNILGFFVVVLGGGAFLLAAFRKPRNVSYGIEGLGVSVDGVVTSYEKLESFWIFPKEQGNILSLKRKGFISQHFRMPVGGMKSEVIRNALVLHIKEEEQHPSVIDSWLRRIGY